MEENKPILSQELELDKQRLVSDIDKVIEAAKQTEERIQTTEKGLNEARWYLGEEKAKREQLENSLKDSLARCQDLESQLSQLRTQLQTVQNELQDTQWFLGEEQAKHTVS